LNDGNNNISSNELASFMLWNAIVSNALFKLLADKRAIDDFKRFLAGF
jgi:hypothetical protein